LTCVRDQPRAWAAGRHCGVSRGLTTKNTWRSAGALGPTIVKVQFTVHKRATCEGTRSFWIAVFHIARSRPCPRFTVHGAASAPCTRSGNAPPTRERLALCVPSIRTRQTTIAGRYQLPAARLVAVLHFRREAMLLAVDLLAYVPNTLFDERAPLGSPFLAPTSWTTPVNYEGAPLRQRVADGLDFAASLQRLVRLKEGRQPSGRGLVCACRPVLRCYGRRGRRTRLGSNYSAGSTRHV
jgi:hypothetical protein